MIEVAPHPKFDRPPVIEVMHGVRFRRLNFDIAHPGHFHDLLKDRYPRVQTVPALPPEREHFGTPQFAALRFEIPLLVELPRAWFISADDTMLIQLQADRLLVNRRVESGQEAYSHFPVISAEFRKVFETLAGFAATSGVGPMEIELCEMAYINKMGNWPRDSVMTPHDWLRGWSSDLGTGWTGDMEDFSSVARYSLTRPDGQAYGRVTTSATTIFMPPSLDRSLQLEVTVRGIPETTDIDGIVGFHEIAHDQIVRCFAAITTDSAHECWGRRDT